MSTNNPIAEQSRRSFITKAVYIAPVVLTLKAMPAFASQGSSRNGDPQIGDNGPVDGGIVEPYETTSFNQPKTFPGARSPHAAAPRRKRSPWSWFTALFDF